MIVRVREPGGLNVLERVGSIPGGLKFIWWRNHKRNPNFEAVQLNVCHKWEGKSKKTIYVQYIRVSLIT